MKKLILMMAGMAMLFGMDPKTYYELSIKSLELTLLESKEQLNCAEKLCSVKERYLINQKYTAKTAELYKRYNTTPVKISSYYTRNKKKLEEYLKTHPEIKEKIQRLEEEIGVINDAINSYNGGGE